MKLGNMSLGPILGASGVEGNFGEGYWYHKLLHGFSLLDLSGLVFVSKTATLNPRKGNTPFVYDENYFSPSEIKPKSIVIKPFQKNVLNAVGLGNPGLEALLKTGHYQSRKDPFLISIMSIAGSEDSRKAEMAKMIAILEKYKNEFQSLFGLQINLSCPNTAHDPCSLIAESSDMIGIAARLGVPLMPKFSIASAPIAALMELNENPHVDAICLSNTLPYDWQPSENLYRISKGDDYFEDFQRLQRRGFISWKSDGKTVYIVTFINWEKIFGTTESPLASMGGGGLSGDIIRPFVLHYIKQLRAEGFSKPINGGGGIMKPEHVDMYKAVGVNSVFIGSVVMTRPWDAEDIIKRANEIF
ncbi:MAG: hypothetical protein U9Q15_01420 [Patescibacteria group bacterium]|nr:hypothetical protein [Patescibacteria group bacterium]